MMKMVFYTANNTPLYSSDWQPHGTGPYAGTCIFLIILAVLFRGLMAGRHLLEHRWMDQQLNRRYVAVRGVPTEAERIRTESEGKNMILRSERGVEEHVRVVKNHMRSVTPWRWSVDLPRAAYVTVTSGVGYLLYAPSAAVCRVVAWAHIIHRMLAVMTMNVGYFLSVLGGTFLGELAVGRYTQLGEH